ncbi:MAG: hypothetical protein KOO60_04585 [Gemmatimonadales bacterium]|nr:hypothetical protein [Gemmatimonadales bacterium]
MRCHSTTSGVMLLLIALLLINAGCSSDKDEAYTPDIRMGSPNMPAMFPAEALRLKGPDDLVLAEGNHGIHLTLAEYNARVDEVPLPADSDTTEVQWQTLQRLVHLKVVAAEGRIRGYVAKDATNTREEERQVVRQVTESGMLSAQLTSNQEAIQYYEQHPDKFPEATPQLLEKPPYLTHIKFTLHNERWLEKVKLWSEREQVVIHRDRFAGLQRPNSPSLPDTLQQEDEL